MSRPLKQALKKISKLEERCNLNSKNSSKPPSSDQKPSGKPPKQKFKKNGAKPGRCRYFRPTFTQGEVDQFIDVEVQKCPTCKGSVKFTGKELIHQQVEIPERPYRVIQYNRKQFYCACCRKYRFSSLPKEVGPSAFGIRLSAFMGFLSGSCRLPRRTCLEVLKQGFGIKVSVGAQSNVEGRLSKALELVYKETEQKVHLSQGPKHVDETTWFLWETREFVWVMSTARAALYKIQEGWGAIYRDQLIGPIKKSAIFITDRLAIYNFKCAHHCCLAHIKRNLDRFAQRTEDDSEWDSQMIERLDHIFHLWREYKTGLRSQRSFQCVSRRYRDLI